MAINDTARLSIALHMLATGNVVWRKHYYRDNVITVSRVLQDARKPVMTMLGRSHLNQLQARDVIKLEIVTGIYRKFEILLASCR